MAAPVTPPLVRLSRRGAELVGAYAFAFLLAGALLVIAGLKFRLIHFYGTDLPSGDQWTGEAEAVVLPYLHGELSWWHLLAPHNEHRILFTRLWSLMCLAVTGQWDARVQMTANVLLHLGSAALLIVAMRQRLQPLAQGLLAVLVVFLLSTCATWENTLSGFQSQFYFLLFLSLAHLVGTFRCALGTPGWWLAQGAAVLNLFTMAGALLAPAAVLAALAFERWVFRERRARWALLLAWNAALLFCGWLLIADAPGHTDLRPATWLQRIGTVVHVLSWPVLHGEWAALLYLPGALFLVQAWRQRRADKVDLLAVAVVLFAALHGAAIAVARGGVASRYMDVLAIGVIANAWCWFSLESKGRWQQLHIAAAAVWLMVVVQGVQYWEKVAHDVTLGPRAVFDRERAAGVRRFLETSDPAWLQLPALKTDAEVSTLERVLQDPVFAAALPSSARAGIALKTGTATLFSEDRLPLRLDSTHVPLPRGVFGLPTTLERRFESEPFVSDYGVVSVWISGAMDGSVSWLALRDGEGQYVYPNEGASVSASGRWKRLNFSVPAETKFQLVAAAGPSAGPFAFSLPVETATASWACGRFLKWWPAFTWAGIIALGLVLVAATSAWLMTDPARIATGARRRRDPK